MAFGTEAVIPVESEAPTERVACFDASTNDQGLALNNDLLEERRATSTTNKLSLGATTARLSHAGGLVA